MVRQLLGSCCKCRSGAVQRPGCFCVIHIPICNFSFVLPCLSPQKFVGSPNWLPLESFLSSVLSVPWLGIQDYSLPPQLLFIKMADPHSDTEEAEISDSHPCLNSGYLLSTDSLHSAFAFPSSIYEYVKLAREVLLI